MFVCMLFVFLSCGESDIESRPETDTREIYTKEQLITVLTEVYNDPNSCIIGGQCDVGRTPKALLEDFKAANGEYPGIIGIDLAAYGYDLMNISEKEKAEIIDEIADYCLNGGIITASSHFANPSGNYPAGSDNMRGLLGYEDSKEGYEKAFKELITEGTELNNLFKKELDTDAEFLKALGDKGVPVLWRPLHEQNGSWFWFCTVQNGHIMNSRALKNLWIYIYDYYTKDWGLDNLVWVFSPNVSMGGMVGTTYCYPGDKYVDMVGCDWYSEGNLEISEGGYRELVDKSGKIGAITEFGPTGSMLASENAGAMQGELYHAMDLYDDLLGLQSKGFSFAYLLAWCGQWSIQSLTRGDEFMSTEYALGQTDMARRFADCE